MVEDSLYEGGGSGESTEPHESEKIVRSNAEVDATIGTLHTDSSLPASTTSVPAPIAVIQATCLQVDHNKPWRETIRGRISYGDGDYEGIS